MNSRQFVDLCRALDRGEVRNVENIVMDETGRALQCDRCRIEVDVNGHRKSWPMEFCQD